MTRELLFLLFGELIASTAIIFIKATGVHPFLLASYRLLLAAAMLTPLLLIRLRRRGRFLSLQELRLTLIPGIILAVHFLTWIAGARITLAANSSLIVNLIPIAMPFVAFFLTGEKLNRMEAAGTLVAMSGMAILVGADYTLSPATFGGDILCFVSMVFYAAYLAYARRNNRGQDLWIYVVPLYWIGGLSGFAASIPFVNPFDQPGGWFELLMIFCLAFFPTVVGHSIMNRSMRIFRPQLVSLINISQFLFSVVWGYLFFAELPEPHFYPASLLIIAGAAVVVLRSNRRREPGLERARQE